MQIFILFIFFNQIHKFQCKFIIYMFLRDIIFIDFLHNEKIMLWTGFTRSCISQTVYDIIILNLLDVYWMIHEWLWTSFQYLCVLLWLSAYKPVQSTTTFMCLFEVSNMYFWGCLWIIILLSKLYCYKLGSLLCLNWLTFF